MVSLFLDLCIRLRHRFALGLAARHCKRVRARIEVEPSVRTIEGPPCAPVFEQLLLARSRPPG